MPEPLRNLYNQELIASLACLLKASYGKFDDKRFHKRVFSNGWEQKELKARINHVAVTLDEYLPGDYGFNIEILKTVSSHFKGLKHMFFPAYVELFGLGDFATSMSALEYFTSNSSSEFAIRPFIAQSPAKAMKQMRKWAGSGDVHVRRLASEGCRPRLPWATALPVFKRDPQPVLDILNQLKNDESDYVRRSVANNLNDISKDNPLLVIKIARKWLGNNPATDQLVKHACRTMLKQGRPEVLALFDLKKPDDISIRDFVVQKEVAFSGKLKFAFVVQTTKAELGKLRVEYAIDFKKSNGDQKRKIFKISESNNSGLHKEISKEFSFRPISTRRYYAGDHGIAIIINGHELINGTFRLTEPG